MVRTLRIAGAALLVVVLALVVLRVLGTAVGGVGTGDDDAVRLGGEADEGPAYRVTYRISGVGTANEPVKITYTTGDGGRSEAEVPGFAPVWSDTVTAEPRLPNVSLTAYGSSSDLAFKLTCAIEVEGVELMRHTGSFSCTAWADLTKAADELARATRAPAPTAAPATTAVKPPPPPRACRYVTAGDLTTVVTRAAGTVKPVLSTSAKGNRCTHYVDQQGGSVSFEVERDGKAGGPPSVRVGGLRERAYYLAYGDSMGELRVALPGGDVFVVTVFFTGLRVDGRQVAVDTYRAARPRLLRER
jgi:hypothetical protein